MAKDPEPKIPPKLERFLLTIARRRSIESIAVTLFVIFDGGIVIGADNALPSRLVGPSGMEAAISAIMDKLELDGEVRYLGFFDKGKVRQYNFAVDLGSRPKLGRGFALADAAGAASLLERKEAKVILGSFERPPVVQQMLVW